MSEDKATPIWVTRIRGSRFVLYKDYEIVAGCERSDNEAVTNLKHLRIIASEHPSLKARVAELEAENIKLQALADEALMRRKERTALNKEIDQLKTENKKLLFMVDNGLGEEDMQYDITYPSGD